MRRLLTLTLTAALLLGFTAVIYADVGITAKKPYKVQEYDIGCGISLYENSDGRWGAAGDNFTLKAKYYLPCDLYGCLAFDDTFVLAKEPSTLLYSEEPDNTYYVFNGSGEIIKTLTYSIKDIWEEAPGGCNFVYVKAKRASGSNIVFSGLTAEEGGGDTGEMEFIKRLYSEKTEGCYLSIDTYKDGEFKAVEGDCEREETWRLCILNPDGSFKEYYRGTEG